MAEQTVAPGVVEEADQHGLECFEGTPEALRAAGLLPEGVRLPGGGRGARGRGGRWIDSQGRQWKLVKSRLDGVVVMSRVLSRVDEESARRQRESETKVAAIDQRLGAWRDSPAQMRVVLRDLVRDDVCARRDEIAIATSPHRGPWVLTSRGRAQFESALRHFLEAIDACEVRFDASWREGLQRQRAALLNPSLQAFIASVEATISRE